MIKTIYHGSKEIVRQPVFGLGKPYNDYGLGFYCTEVLDMAKEWGADAGRDGYANRYSMDCTGLKILDLNDRSYCFLHWLCVLLENREFTLQAGLALEARQYILSTFSVDYKNSDVILGYRADDSYFSFAQDFLNGTISYRQLSNTMRLGRLGRQFVLKSKQAFERITFEGYEIAPADEWYPKKQQRDRLARRDYFDVERNRRRRDDLYITQILDEEMKANDERLR